MLPPADLIAEGRSSLRLPFTVRCKDCGERRRPDRAPEKNPPPSRMGAEVSATTAGRYGVT